MHRLFKGISQVCPPENTVFVPRLSFSSASASPGGSGSGVRLSPRWAALSQSASRVPRGPGGFAR